MTFVINERQKLFYYRVTKQFETTKEYLIDTCYSAQDEYKKLVDYFMEE